MNSDNDLLPDTQEAKPLIAKKDKVILVGGWAQPDKSLTPLAEMLEQPGVDISILPLSESEPTIIRNLNQQISLWLEENESLTIHLVGWSLGGLLLIKCLQELEHKQSFNNRIKLTLVCCNPCFKGKEARDSSITSGIDSETDPYWPGVGEQVYGEFESQLRTDSNKLLNRFYKLQCFGDPDYKNRLALLKSAMHDVQQWSHSHLLESLSWLQRDMRQALATLSLPVTHILGGKDKLVPVELAEYLGMVYPKHQVICLEDMAHYPSNKFAQFLVSQIKKEEVC